MTAMARPPSSIRRHEPHRELVGLAEEAGLRENAAAIIDDVMLTLVLTETGRRQNVLKHRQLFEWQRRLMRASDPRVAARLDAQRGDVAAIEEHAAAIGSQGARPRP
jgi:hypothetical protein